VFSNNGFNITSLMNAVYQDDDKATSVFLKSGANVNESNIAGVSPLHISAKNNSINSMKVLIKYNAELNARDNEMWTPLMRACLNNNPESVEILIKNGANIWLKNNFNESALTHAVMSNCIECLRIIKDNTRTNAYEINDVINEINKSLHIVYKK
jgi:ankyrin repeat protein